MLRHILGRLSLLALLLPIASVSLGFTASTKEEMNLRAVPLEAWQKAGDVIQPYAQAGVTWWIEDVSPWRFGNSWEVQWQREFSEQMSAMIRMGPPKV